MDTRQRIKAVLHYEKCDKLPVVHFSYWTQTVEKWAREGHIPRDIMETGDSGAIFGYVNRALGWDQDFGNAVSFFNMGLFPGFAPKVVRELADGSKHVMNGDGVTELHKPGAVSIPAEIEHLLKDRASWEEHYLHRVRFTMERYNDDPALKAVVEDPGRDFHLGLHAGSIYGTIRNWIGVVGTSYMMADDPGLLKEIIDAYADMQYKCVEYTLENVTDKFDAASMWEDICFNYGPLINPELFEKWCGPHYARLRRLFEAHGIDIIYLDCDGCIDKLVPVWVENGVNTMFPIEVGTWGGSYADFRNMCGKKVRGVGGMDKRVFAYDRKAVDREIERLKPIIDLGGFIPCPDHRIAPDAVYENVQYYVDRMQNYKL
ncbi:MAG: hypothetical protein ILO36_07615 [Abditibacteriota bacterium]|nr:hypothetical protein [Abditibacteriota bacterium]